jgi:hypothetical protein
LRHTPPITMTPFAAHTPNGGSRYGAMVVVGKVYTGSPAASAGLVEDDVVVELGGQSGNGYVDVLTSLVPIIAGSEGTPLDATVIRVRGRTGAWVYHSWLHMWVGGYTGGCGGLGGWVRLLSHGFRQGHPLLGGFARVTRC